MVSPSLGSRGAGDGVRAQRVGQLLLPLLCLTVAAGGCAADVPPPAGAQSDSAGLVPASGSQGGRLLRSVEGDSPVIRLTGEAVVPGPGDDDAVGEAVVALVDGRNELCVEIAVRDLDQPTSAHLHEAGAGKAGDVVLALPAPRDGDATVDACVSAEPAVLERFRAAAEGFYVIVHSTSFPEGALRGQLR